MKAADHALRVSNGMPFLADMIIMSEQKKVLPEGWQTRYHTKMREAWQRKVDSGQLKPEVLGFFDSESIGSDCPICGSSPEPSVHQMEISGFSLGVHNSYALTCDCEHKFYQNEEDEREIKLRLQEADIPEIFSGVSWNTWDIVVDPKLSESFRKVQSFTMGDSIYKLLSTGIAIFGEVGRGKTMAGICLMRSIIQTTGRKCKYIPMVDFTKNVISAGKDGNYLDRLDKYDVLFLDDLDKLASSSGWVQERIFSLFDSMFRSQKCLIFTTNKNNFTELQNHFGEHGEAIVSRMISKMEYAYFIGGDDYRKSSRLKELKERNAGVTG